MSSKIQTLNKLKRFVNLCSRMKNINRVMIKYCKRLPKIRLTMNVKNWRKITFRKKLVSAKNKSMNLKNR